MLNPRRWLPAIFVGLAALAATVASAAGFGAGAPGAVLGQPLDFAVQVRLEPGESADCVVAEVTAGDRRLPPGQVRTQVEAVGADLARIRVLTQQGLDEPVIGINLSVGCSARMTRQFVVLADPPITPAVTSAGLAAAPPMAAPVLANAPLEPMPAAATTVSAANSAAAAVVPGAEGAPIAAPPPAVARVDAAAAPRPRVARDNKAAAARTVERSARKPAAGRREAAARPRPAASAKEAAPRLRLDMLEASAPGGGAIVTAELVTVAATEAVVVDQALQAVAQAASAARAAASAASAASERIASLEHSMAQMRSQAKASEDLVAQLRTRLAQSDGSSRWLLPLLTLVAFLAALAAWLAWRMTRMQAAQQQVWRRAAAPAPGPGDVTPSRMPTAPIPFVTSEIQVPAAPLPPRPRPKPAWPPAAPADNWAPSPIRAAPPPDPRSESRSEARDPRRSSPGDTTVLTHLLPRQEDEPTVGERRIEPPMQRTEVLPPHLRPDDSAARDVSIEELIDLEQQAEFFVVLGQDEAAIDLLVDHLRNTGGGSPLPYLKLLEIHHRRGDKAAYERMRTRFNHRFNAYAPEWDMGEMGLHGGRSLEDYAGIVPRLQQVWSRPLDAMAELEALLFRKSRGELFDLPAYREVLFLYSLARDLLDREAADTGNVDLLLPLSEGGEFSTTAPSPFLGLERGRHPDDTVDFDNRPTSPVDFDLTAAERPTSIFDQLDDKPHTRRP